MAFDLADLSHCMRLSGLTPPDHVVADGEIHRFSSNGKAGDDAGWYVAHCAWLGREARYYGAFGCWRTGLRATWTSHEALSFVDRERLSAQIRAAQRQRSEQKAKRDDGGALWARSRWDSAGPCDATHPYLAAKHLPLDHRLRTYCDDLLIPMSAWDGALWNLQTVGADGRKRFGSGRAAGLVMVLGDQLDRPRRVLICEGYATGRSAELCELADLCVVAFSAGQLSGAAIAAQRRWPMAAIVLLADNDAETPGNPGVTESMAAAGKVGGVVWVPRDGDGKCDFNDLWARYSTGAVRYLDGEEAA